MTWHLFASFTPRFYASFHKISFINSIFYLFRLLLIYECVRHIAFLYRYQNEIKDIEYYSCIKDIAYSFPEGLQIQLINDKFYFSKGTPILIELPDCVKNSFGLFISYLSHGSFEPDDLWSIIASYVILIDDDSQALNILEKLDYNTNTDKIIYSGREHTTTLSTSTSQIGKSNAAGKASNIYNSASEYYEAPLLVIARTQAWFFYFMPARQILKQIMRKISNLNGYSREGAKIKIDKKFLKKAYNQYMMESIAKSKTTSLVLGWNWSSIAWLPFQFLCCVIGFMIGMLASLDLLITSTILFVLVRQGRLTASFRFWNMKKHFFNDKIRLGLTDAQLELEQQQLEADYAREIADNFEINYFPNLTESYFIGISIHTATLALLIDAIFPNPINHSIGIGIGAIVHICSTMFVCHYFALPGILIENFVGNRFEEQYQRRQQQVNNNDENVQQEQRNRQQQEEQQQQHIAIDSKKKIILSQWSLFLGEQQFIRSTLHSHEMSFEAKMATIIFRMQSICKNIYFNNVHILHVWSHLNSRKSAKGGPGWIYGLSHTKQAWIMLAWFDHPCSPMGINAISTFPGQVYIESESNSKNPERSGNSVNNAADISRILPCLFLPSQEEIIKLKSKLAKLQNMVNSLKS